jgi:putative transcriptional regulator
MDRRYIEGIEMKKTGKEAVAARVAFYQEIDSGRLNLAQTLKKMRKLIGKNQSEFASIVGVAPGVIQAIEQNRANPSLETLEKIGKLYGLVIGFRRKPHEFTNS